MPTNERLEFLGDSVLGIAVTDELYHRYPDKPEGDLAKLRAAIVNTDALAEIAITIGLGEFVRLGKGEESTGGRRKTSILADCTEAVIGAVYLTNGIEIAREFVLGLVEDLMKDSVKLGAGLDWKTSLQELTARHGLGVPVYDIVASGPDHNKWFDATVSVAGESRGAGGGSSKKVAERQAAQQAWQTLRDLGYTPAS